MRVAQRDPGVNPNALLPVGPGSFEPLSSQSYMTGIPVELIAAPLSAGEMRRCERARRARADRSLGPPRAVRRWLTLGVVLVVLVLGGLVSLLLYRQADDSARAQESDLTTRAARTLGEPPPYSTPGSPAAPRSSPTAPSTRRSFDAFADRVAAATELRTLGYEPVVADAERAAFEQRIGGPITEVGPTASCSRRPPPGRTRRSVDPPDRRRRRAIPASTSRRTPTAAPAGRGARHRAPPRSPRRSIASPTVRSPSSSSRRSTVRAPRWTTLDARRANVVGYVTASVPATRSSPRCSPRPVRTPASRSPTAACRWPRRHGRRRGGHRVDVIGGGRPWVVTLQRDAPRHTNALLSVLATLLAAGVVGIALQRNRRKTVALRASARSVQALGQLTEHLAEAESLDRMADAISTYAPDRRGAACGAGPDDPEHPDALVRRGSGGEVIAGGSHPLLDARRLGREVIVRDAGDLRRRYPDMSAAYAARGTEAVAALPLHRAPGEVFGVLGLEWAGRERFGQRTRDAITAAAELCQQNVLRVQAQERRRRRRCRCRRSASACRWCARSTRSPTRSSPTHRRRAGRRSSRSASSTPAHPAAADAFAGRRPTTSAPACSSRCHRSGRTADRAAAPRPAGDVPHRAEIDRRRRCASWSAGVDRLSLFPLIDSTGCSPGCSCSCTPTSGFGGVERAGADADDRRPRRPDPRARLLYQRQHDLVLELQRRTLPALPAIPGLSIAARYLPSSSALGLGGDWYDVQPIGDGHRRPGRRRRRRSRHRGDRRHDRDPHDRVDVAAHRRRPLDVVVVERPAGHRRDADVVFATAVLMVVDLAARAALRARRSSAADAAPCRRQVVLLDAAGTTPIGVDGRDAAVGVAALVTGALIVAYTDGLVERRDETIDVGLERLRDGARRAAPVRATSSGSPTN